MPVLFQDTKLNKSDFLSELNNYKFVIAPFGNGLDTHRVWEAIYSNSIPIVKKSIRHITLFKAAYTLCEKLQRY